MSYHFNVSVNTVKVLQFPKTSIVRLPIDVLCPNNCCIVSVLIIVRGVENG